MGGYYNVNAMPATHKGHVIEELEGDPNGIWARGDQIEKLGQKMVKAADTLERIKDGSDGSNGKSMEQVREAVGDMTDDLRTAGTTYAGVGPVLKTYAGAIGPLAPGYHDLQGDIKKVVADAKDAWARYKSAEADVPTSGGMVPMPDKDDPDYDTKVKAASDREDEFWGLADQFDGYYETWETAFDKAADDIDSFVDDGIHDGFWDNVDGFVSAALKVLSWVGLVVGILAIIIGGPILGAIAAVVGLVVLALTVYRKIRGDASWGDLALATVAVLPLGKFVSIARAGSKGAVFAKFAEEGTGGLSKLATAAGRADSKLIKQFTAIKSGWVTGSLTGRAGAWKGAWSGWQAIDGPASPSNMLLRLTTGRSYEQWDDALKGKFMTPDVVLDTAVRIGYDGLYKRTYKIPSKIADIVAGSPSAQPVR
jgi:hypothetical protein